MATKTCACALGQKAGGASTSGGRTPSVLVVDDDDVIREVVRDMLEDEGYGVTTAANGIEALDLLARGPRPCVVLLDLMMPVMSGWQVLAELERDAKLEELPVVVITAAASQVPAPPGARTVLAKPLAVETLLAAVEEYCG